MKRDSGKFRWAAITIAVAAVPIQVLAQTARPEPARPAVSPYAPYEWLIGEWLTEPRAGPVQRIRQRFAWGPQRAYIMYTISVVEGSKPEALHLEGMMTWNPRTKVLDYVIAHDPGTFSEETGTLALQADGSIVREVEGNRPDGSVEHYRQTFIRSADGHVSTRLMHLGKSGWEPNFPGSEDLSMARSS